MRADVLRTSFTSTLTHEVATTSFQSLYEQRSYLPLHYDVAPFYPRYDGIPIYPPPHDGSSVLSVFLRARLCNYVHFCFVLRLTRVHHVP